MNTPGKLKSPCGEYTRMLYLEQATEQVTKKILVTNIHGNKDSSFTEESEAQCSVLITGESWLPGVFCTSSFYFVNPFRSTPQWWIHRQVSTSWWWTQRDVDYKYKYLLDFCKNLKSFSDMSSGTGRCLMKKYQIYIQNISWHCPFNFRKSQNR